MRAFPLSHPPPSQVHRTLEQCRKLMPIAKDLGARESFFSIDRLFSLCSLSSQSISCAGKSASGLKEVVEEFKTGMAEGETGVSQDGGATAVKSAEPAPEEKTDA